MADPFGYLAPVYPGGLRDVMCRRPELAAGAAALQAEARRLAERGRRQGAKRKRQPQREEVATHIARRIDAMQGRRHGRVAFCWAPTFHSRAPTREAKNGPRGPPFWPPWGPKSGRKMAPESGARFRSSGPENGPRDRFLAPKSRPIFSRNSGARLLIWDPREGPHERPERGCRSGAPAQNCKCGRRVQGRAF